MLTYKNSRSTSARAAYTFDAGNADLSDDAELREEEPLLPLPPDDLDPDPDEDLEPEPDDDEEEDGLAGGMAATPSCTPGSSDNCITLVLNHYIAFMSEKCTVRRLLFTITARSFCLVQVAYGSLRPVGTSLAIGQEEVSLSSLSKESLYEAESVGLVLPHRSSSSKLLITRSTGPQNRCLDHSSLQKGVVTFAWQVQCLNRSNCYYVR